ncbi:MAG: hypothetical protein DHS20C17_15090 [Cyclobacteriaceae bacterium]|nr:MAG: hypothetical protein DHS20C17_15090 [Cyclobacteriaceae bacterium]
MNRLGNKSLGVLLALLVLISVSLSFWERGSGNGKIDTDLFVVENIDPIDRIVISNQQEILDCRAFSGGFKINDEFVMDQDLLTVLAAVFQRVRVQRPLSGNQQQQVYQSIKETGSHIELYQGDQLLTSFWAGGDPSEQNSYFATEEGAVYLVHLPGYTSYVSGLFQLPLAKWRSRTIFNNTWRSLLTYSFQDFNDPENDFQINYQDPFFQVPGVQQLDSNNVIDYLQRVVSLTASAVVDTAYQGMPALELTTTDIDPAKNQTLTLYGEDDQPVMLGKSGNQYFTFARANIEPLLKNSRFFEKDF